MASVSKAASALQSLGPIHELSRIVKLAQESMRETLERVVSLSFLNLFCVNVDFEVKLHGAVASEPRALAEQTCF